MAFLGESARLSDALVAGPDDRLAAPADMADASRIRRELRYSFPTLPVVMALDVLAVLAVFAIIVIGINIRQMPHGIDGFLALRVTIKNVLIMTWLAVGVMVVFNWVGLYDVVRVRRPFDDVRRVLLGTAVVTLLAGVAPLTSHANGVRASSLPLFWASAAFVLIVTRELRMRLTGRARERRRVIIVGTGPHGLRIYRQLCADVRSTYYVVGFVDTIAAASPFLSRRTLGRLVDLEPLLVREHVDEVHIGLPVKSHYAEIQETIRVCERLGVRATYRADIFNTAIAMPRVRATGDRSPGVQLQMTPDGWRLALKRLIDIVGALVALVLFAPVGIVIAVAIKLTSGGPVIYAQERYGLNRRRFQMYKFRTMVADAERLQAALEARNEAAGPVFKIADDPRITPIGRFLRRSSLDELPQLFNVLRGDMSLVGPRPLPSRDVTRFTRTSDLRRLSVRPGLTCLWQVNGRSSISFDEWVRLDLQYIDQWSLSLDLLILARTIPAVLRGTGAA
jgi:exopolysaccharide biosynthesis polyprenyl glycosylphosphotransferase